jgi:hypothetical protein
MSALKASLDAVKARDANGAGAEKKSPAKKSASKKPAEKKTPAKRG